MINYTIIVPHYKSLDTLPRLLLSIPDRIDIQIVVIDDYSQLDKDKFNCLPVFKSADLRIIFLSENRGAGGARNEGLKIAKGKWLIFADSDDFFLPSAFEFCDDYLDSTYDIVYFRITSVESETLIKNDRYKANYRYVQQYDKSSEATKDLLKFHHDVPWGKLINSANVYMNNILFDETRYYNDTIFSTNVALSAKEIHVDLRPFYCVTTKQGSLMSQHSKDAILIRLEVILRKNQLLRKHGKGKYQYSILPFIKQLLKYGWSAVFKGIRLGYKYNANFFIGIPQKIKEKFFFHNISNFLF